MYEPKEIGARKRAEHSEIFAREYVRACTSTDPCTMVYVYVRARVCFFNEIYYRTPNASGHEERVLLFFPPANSHPRLAAATVANVVAVVFVVVAAPDTPALRATVSSSRVA